MKAIIVTGTPGTGKTTLSKQLARKLSLNYLDVNLIIKKYGLSEGYDKKRKTKIIDTKKLNKAIIMEMTNYKKARKIKTNGVIIDSHLSHYLPKKYVDLCIVTKCSLKVLKKRLENKGYSKNKVRENLDAEIFGICLEEAKENGHNVLIIDTTKGINTRDFFKKAGGLIGI